MARKLKPRTPIAERLVKAREALSLDRKGLAAALDWNLSTLGNYELGSSFPDPEFLNRLQALGVSLDWLITGRGEASAGLHLAQAEPERQEHDEAELDKLLRATIKATEECLAREDAAAHVTPERRAQLHLWVYRLMRRRLKRRQVIDEEAVKDAVIDVLVLFG
ncbi:MAG: helix-turn-helix transcriptional regulator [Alphaproteobacteria bacterium]|nr:helix-turn-helix transcriptional regulator [Alphaproteobacteria bacterium]